MAIVVGIVVVLALAVVALLVSGRRHSTTGRLSRETQKRDTTAGGSSVPAEAAPEGEESVAALSGDARSRADDARRAIESGDSPVPATTGAVPATTGAKTPVRYEPVDEDEIGLSRRQFFNRSILATLGPRPRRVRRRGHRVPVALGRGWRRHQDHGGLRGRRQGGVRQQGARSTTRAPRSTSSPTRSRTSRRRRRSLRTRRCSRAWSRATSRCTRSACTSGAACRGATSSQWFECPCHGSKYNRVGEKRGGPAPRGLDRFRLEVTGGNIIVDTSEIIVGPPIGTDTTGQSPEGAPCV